VTAFQFEVEGCCAPWVEEGRWRVTDGIVRAILRCSGCGQRRAITVTNRAARSDELAHRHLEAV
jgi:hypothetical protein